MNSDNQIRTQRPRSTKGCQTCKHRRVKCDESKPNCQRCIKAGRQCEYVAEGYHLLNRKFVVYSAPRELSTTPDLDTPDKQALHYFRCRAATEMTAPFQSMLWRECIFRFAERHDFVMSALVALSTMHQSYSQEADSRARLQADANRLYNKAMKSIRQAAASELPMDAVLVAIIVFHTLESLRGCYQAALQHARSGLALIGEQSRSSPSRQVATLDEALYRDFLALQNQAREFGHCTMVRAYDTRSGFEPAPCDEFESVDEALHHLSVIYNEIYCVLDHCQRMQEAGVALEEFFETDIRPGWELVMMRFKRWVHGVDLLGLTVDKSPGRERQAFLLLRIYQSIFTAMLNSFPSSDCFEGHNEHVAQALQLAEMFLQEDEDARVQGRRPFALYVGVIPVLFITCWRSRAGAIRDKSLELLRLADRREGVWDSAVAYQLAQRIIALKDRLAGNGTSASPLVQVAEVAFDSELTCKVICTIVDSEADVAGVMLPFEGAESERQHVEVINLAKT